MPVPKITERHERTITRTYTKAELEGLVRKALYEELGEERWVGEPDVSIRFEDETAGSPAYRVGTKATITVTVDLNTSTPIATTSSLRPASRTLPPQSPPPPPPSRC